MKTFKKALCLVLVAVMAIGLFAVAASAKSLSDYSDAKDVGSVYKTVVDFDTQLGVLRGHNDNVYKPQGTLTRAELATIIYRITTGDVDDKFVDNYKNGSTFSDVKSDNWFAGYVNWSADNKYLVGVGGGKYDPNSNLTGYQAMAALLRTLGYDKNGEFIGKDWTKAVTKAANESGISNGIVADWAKPISREVTAQLIFNTLFASKVDYSTIRLAYSKNYETLAEDVFKLVQGPAGRVEVDSFGKPSTAWYKASDWNFSTNEPRDGKKPVVRIYDNTVKTYTKGVTGCQILVDLGIPETDVTTVIASKVRTLNGGVSNIPLTHKGQACEKIFFGGNGVLTEVFTEYDADGNLYALITETEFFLAKVTKNKAATHGATAYSQAEIYEQTTFENIYLDTVDYPVGTYVLVTAPAFAAGVSLPVATVVGTPTTFVGKLDKVTLKTLNAGNKIMKQNFYTIKGTDYEYSYNKYYDYTGVNVEETYTWFVDAYGYIIGSELYEAPQSYGVINKMFYETAGYNNGKANASVVYMDATTGELVVSTIDNLPVSYDNMSAGTAQVSQDYKQNGKYYGVLYNLTTGAIAEQLPIGNRVDWADTIENNKPELDAANKIYTGKNTVFLYKLPVDAATGDYVYKTYTGYANAPAADGANIWYVNVKADANGDKFVKYVFVDASQAGLRDVATKNIIVKNPMPVEVQVMQVNGVKYDFWTYEAYDMSGNKLTLYSSWYAGVKSANFTPFTTKVDDGTGTMVDTPTAGIYAVTFRNGFVQPVEIDYPEYIPFSVSMVEIENADTYTDTVFKDVSANKTYGLDGVTTYLVDANGVTLVEADNADLVAAFADKDTSAANYQPNEFYFVTVHGVITAYYVFVY